MHGHRDSRRERVIESHTQVSPILEQSKSASAVCKHARAQALCVIPPMSEFRCV
jgi:hypothetical protein